MFIILELRGQNQEFKTKINCKAITKPSRASYQDLVLKGRKKVRKKKNEREGERERGGREGKNQKLNN